MFAKLSSSEKNGQDMFLDAAEWCRDLQKILKKYRTIYLYPLVPDDTDADPSSTWQVLQSIAFFAGRTLSDLVFS